MRAEAIVRALLELWEELPSLVGQDWPGLYPKVEILLERIQHRGKDTERSFDAADLILSFRKYPAARLRLRDTIDKIESLPDWSAKGTFRSGEALEAGRDVGQGPPSWSEIASSLRNRITSPTVTRYADVTAPRKLAVGHRSVVTVGLTRIPSLASAGNRRLEIDPSILLEVHLQASEAIQIQGVASKHLQVDPEKDVEPVVFYIQGRMTGEEWLVLDFRQAGLHVGSVRFEVEVVEKELPEEQQKAEAAFSFGGPYIPPVDLDIRVIVESEDGRTRLAYVLHSPGGTVGFHYQSVKGPVLTGSPEEYAKSVLMKLRAWGMRQDLDGQPLTRYQAANRLSGLGRQLYTELFPPEMRTAYRRFYKQVKVLQITSDEPWFPWEIVKPYDDSDPTDVLDHDFLCAQFQMTRWLAGPSCPQGRIHVQRLACIEAAAAPGQNPLPFATEERTYIASLAQSGPEDASPSPADLASIEALLDEGGIGLWHFATHGKVDPSHPEDAAVILADGRQFRAEDLHGPRQTLIARDRPLVFLNACRVGQQGFSLTRLGGWAAAWVQRSRCGTFIGPLWAVDDQLAFKFAQAFYDALKENTTIGQAVATARSQVRNLDAESPTWLAYSVYAHPNARVTLEPIG